jgi:hypothetical protein
MSAHDKQVGLITISDEVLVWNVGRSLTSLEQPEIPKSEGSYWSPEAIIFHPLDAEHSFIFYHDWPGAGLLVQEFVNGTHHKTHRTDFGSDLKDSSGMKNLDLRIVGIANNHGLCTIGWDVSLISHKTPYWVKTFNMYTCEFGTMLHPSPAIPRKLEDTARDMREQEGPFVLEFTLDHSGVVEHCANTIRDDDFEILFGDYGYIVWAFGDIRLPLAGSLLDESMEIAPAARPLPLNRKSIRQSA